jgi:hypothetical protein
MAMTDKTAISRAYVRQFLDRAAAAGLGPVGQSLNRYAEAKGQTLEAVAGELGCDLESLGRISLCSLPRRESFDADTVAIAAVGGADAARLGAILREYHAHSDALLAAEPGASYETRPGDDPP